MPVWNLSQIKNSKLKTKKFAKNRQKDAIVANLQLLKQHHLFSWTQLAPKVKAIRGHKNSFLHEKKTPKKRKKSCHRENENKNTTNSAFAWRRIAILVALVRMYL